MARIRTLKPEIFQSPQVMNLTLAARVLFIGLISQADDEGRGSADPRKLRAAIFPGDDDINAPRLTELKAELARERLAIFYTSEEHGDLYALVSWARHQSIDRPRKSIFQVPPKMPSVNGTRASHEPSTTPIGSRSVDDHASKAREGSDLKDLNGSERSLRAHASDPKGLAALEEKARKLRTGGMAARDIVKSLGQYGVTSEQLESWLGPESTWSINKPELVP